MVLYSIQLRKEFVSDLYSNIPVNPPYPPLLKGGKGGLELGCITQIGLDDLGVILDDLRRPFCDPLSEI